MAVIDKRRGERGIRWRARVRRAGRSITKTFPTKAAAEDWARAQEVAIQSGEYAAPDKSGTIFADLVDRFLVHRQQVRRQPATTFGNALSRLKRDLGLERPAELTPQFWLRWAHKEIAKGRASQTVTGDLLYAASVVRHAKRTGIQMDRDGPHEARRMLAEEGHRTVSQQRTRRLSDEELVALFAWIDANKDRTSVPLRDIVQVGLATAMRRGELLRITRSDLDPTRRVVVVRGRKHPRDKDRVDLVPLMKQHKTWPQIDPLEVLRRQPKIDGEPRLFPCKGDTIGFWFERACEGAGIKDACFHVLRHEALSRYAERGLDIMRLQLIGGHRDIRHLQRYARLDAEKLANENE